MIPAYRLRPDVAAQSVLSVYSDDVWNLEPGNEDTHLGPSANFVDFSFYPPRWRELARAFGWCALNFDHRALPDKLGPVRPSKVKEIIRDLLRYCHFVEGRGKSLSEVDENDLTAWISQWAEKSFTQRLRQMTLVRRLHYYRRHLPSQLPSNFPWEGTSNSEIIGNKSYSDENATVRVPRDVMDPMLAWALLYVQVAADDIFELLRQKQSDNCNKPPSSGLAHIPGTSVPWRPNFESRRELEVEAHFLVIAAYIVVAYLSGMRDGEAQSIERGAAETERDAKGVPVRYRVRAKSSAKHCGRRQIRTWIVLPEVHEALSRLEDLALIMKERIPDSPGLKNTHLMFRRYRDIKRKDASFHSNVPRWLRKFQEHVNELAEKASAKAAASVEKDTIDYLYTVPFVDGQPWNWITKQFRRTIAWYIANEPFGIVAGMRQFGHVREATFQGYAGSPEAGFRDEIERARELGKARDILDIYESVRDGARLGGPKGAQLTKEFREIAERLGDLPGKVVDEKRLLAMLKNVAKTVYPGLLTDCFFDADTALCLQKRKQSRKDQPVFAQCDIEKCPNSCFSGKHRAMIEFTILEAKQHCKQPKLSRNQRLALNLVVVKFERALGLIGSDGQTH